MLMGKTTNKHQVLILAVIGLGLLGGVVAYFVTSDSTSDSEEATELSYKTLNDDEFEANLSQEAAKLLAETDTSGYSEDELYSHYLMLAEFLVSSTDYQSAVFMYEKAAEAKPEEASIFIAQAEAYIAAGDADGAKSSYQKALDAFKASGADGVEQYEEYIQFQVDNVDAAIESGYGPIYDGRSHDDDGDV